MKKINLQNLKPQDGFDTFDFLRNGGVLDEQKVSAVIRYLIDAVNELIDANEAMQKQLAKGGVKLKSAKPK